ncbi:hypothetical protein SDC9_195112 [bioreactor metagenome]|uniref:Uncharacterized protein n=1 Tax=bioreactor metagenome TaxID=1076179 RepID=A0A645I8R5_9ZZZZ
MPTLRIHQRSPQRDDVKRVKDNLEESQMPVGNEKQHDIKKIKHTSYDRHGDIALRVIDTRHAYPHLQIGEFSRQ